MTSAVVALLTLGRPEGVTALHAVIFFIAVFQTIGSYVFMSAAQPTVLHDVLGVDRDDVGQKSGDVNFYSELLIIVLVAPWGGLSDKVGRRLVWSLGFLFMGGGLVAYPFASSYGMLVLYRLGYGVGAAAAAAMMTAVLADYFTMPAKGKAAGVMGAASGLGAVFSALVYLRIPSLVADKEVIEIPGSSSDDEVSPVWAVRVMYGIFASVMGLSALMAIAFLRGKGREQEMNLHRNLFVIVKEGYTAARNDLYLALSYAVGFVARGDSQVLTLWLSLWVNDTCRDEGSSSADASAKAGVITGIAQTCALCAAPLVGLAASKLGALRALVLVTVIALIGYGGISFFDDPRTTGAVLMACIIGVGEIGVIIVGQQLVTQRAPLKYRGSVGGSFGLAGSVGILFCTKVGGVLYDNWTRRAPFIVFAGANGVVLVLAAVLAKWGPPVVPIKETLDEERPVLSMPRAGTPIAITP